MARPRELSELTYSTYRPLLCSIEDFRGPLTELSDALDALEGAIATERPTQAKTDAAMEAFRLLPELAAAFERAVAPRHVWTLQRRLARIRGVRKDEFERGRR